MLFRRARLKNSMFKVSLGMRLVGRMLPGFVRFLANNKAFSALVAPVPGRLKVGMLPERDQLVFKMR